MSSSLDMSLDEIIRNKRRQEGHFRDSRRNPRASGPGPDRRGPTREPLRTNPYPVRPQMQVQVHAAASDGQFVSDGGPDTEAKLLVSNLDYDVTNEDVKVLFSEVGELKRYSINYDRSGRSKGTAEVVFYQQADALAAIKRYSNVQLDGKPMTIELVGANVVISAPVPPTRSVTVRSPNVSFRRDQERVGGRGWVHDGGNRPNGGGGGGGGRRFGRGRGPGGGGQQLSAEDLDADLDKYRLEAKKN